MDQIAAKQIGRDTQLPSLELAMDLNPLAGVCNNGYACVYQNCLSWSSPTTPLPSEAHPRIVFERLFGEGGNARRASRGAAQTARACSTRSATISRRLKQRVGVPDRVRVDQYLESVREIERQIQRAEAGAMDNDMPDLDRPVGVPAAFADHAKLMFDLQIAGVSGRHHARHHVPDDARAEQPDVSRDRRGGRRTIRPAITATTRKRSRRSRRSTRSMSRCSRSSWRR